MNVYVVTRTYNCGTGENRVVEAVHTSKESAELTRKAMIDQYKYCPQLCVDTEVDEMELLPNEV